MNKKLLEAYLICLELAKENAFKCAIWIEVNKGEGDPFFVVWIKNFEEDFKSEQRTLFCSFLPNEIDGNIEKVKQLINESI